jgi:arsenite methyltransferase
MKRVSSEPSDRARLRASHSSPAAAAVTESVRDYYARVLRSSADLATSACCIAERVPLHVAAILPDIHPEVKDKFYGCGSPVPPALDGATVLDLGCGSGRDCFVLARLVGPRGRVIGIDMTGEQLAVARRHEEWQARRFGYAAPNTRFVQGYIEELGESGVGDGSVDLVISNCVLNLSPDKRRVFDEIFRVLKPGGELYFSDVFADRRVPDDLAADPVLLGECLGGALYRQDFRRLVGAAGCADPRLVSSVPLTLGDAAIERRIGFVRFTSETLRAFKLPLEDRCEDYGHVATYLGTVAEAPHRFVLDDLHAFEAGRPTAVCGNTADMLSLTRYATHFRVTGDRSRHFGLFTLPGVAGSSASPPGLGAACC